MKNETKYVIFKTKWGFFGLLANEKGLLRTSLPVKSYEKAIKYLLVGMSKNVIEDRTMYLQLRKGITDYYIGNYIDFKMLRFVLSLENLTDFSRKVLNSCRNLSIGQTVTYGQLAQMVGFPGAARAVGSVMANNKLPLIIGCHRVIRSDGVIGEFSGDGGSETKKRMIEHEKQVLINKGVKYDSNKESHDRQCPCCDRPIFAGNPGRQYDISLRPDWT